METTEEQLELLALPVSGVKPRSEFAQWLAAFTKHGWLLPPGLVASYLGVSNQRVQQLLNDDRIATVRVCGHRMVPLVAVELYKKEDKSLGGRPRKSARPIRIKELLDEGKRLAGK